MQKYIVDGQYKQILEANGVKLSEALKKAQLPAGLFLNDKVLMTSDEYFRFMEAIGSLIPDAETYIRLSTAEGIETFTPPIFAAYCSTNGEECIERLARYKKLIGPMFYDLLSDGNQLTLKLDSIDDHELSGTFAIGEFLFLVNLMRKAMKEQIKPLSVMVTMENPAPEYSDYMGICVESGDCNKIVFSLADLELPFISHNESMWNYFLPELDKRLSEMEIDDSYGAKVRSVLSELMPAGKCSIDDVAKELNMSKRSLQRKLSEEDTTFQKQLNSAREILAKHYLVNTKMDTNDIAYLLGYLEQNSFLRAFVSWTGVTPAQFRKQ